MKYRIEKLAEPALVGVSESMRQVVQLVDTVAQSDCCVLIEGESGTGKELVARGLHAKSPRHDKLFIPTNCAGISETLFESQFFGHLRGSFTGADRDMLGLVRSAAESTLFLDEIAEIPLRLQSKFLRVLQDGEIMPVGATAPIHVDTRFVAATNRDLKDEVAAGRFRADLYHRINIVHIYLQPLRQRAEDVEPLVKHFRSLYAKQYQRPAVRISGKVLRCLAGYDWPGNVRELAAWVERLYATGQKPEKLAELLIANSQPVVGPNREPVSLRQAERQAILHALQATDNNRTRAAKILKINRATLLRKIGQYEIV